MFDKGGDVSRRCIEPDYSLLAKYIYDFKNDYVIAVFII